MYIYGYKCASRGCNATYTLSSVLLYRKNELADSLRVCAQCDRLKTTGKNAITNKPKPFSPTTFSEKSDRPSPTTIGLILVSLTLGIMNEKNLNKSLPSFYSGPLTYTILCFIFILLFFILYYLFFYVNLYSELWNIFSDVNWANRVKRTVKKKKICVCILLTNI